jgi:hypothetical protein
MRRFLTVVSNRSVPSCVPNYFLSPGLKCFPGPCGRQAAVAVARRLPGLAPQVRATGAGELRHLVRANDEGHTPHDHNELILRFCKAAGLSSEEVRSVKMTPVWWGRALYYYQIGVQEPIGAGPRY